MKIFLVQINSSHVKTIIAVPETRDSPFPGIKTGPGA